uniref:Tryptophan-rich sensory protein n=1 Tax=candidate division WOR-3 bacterium TaxID=2052148 RepID=A0A7C4CAW5_UNCW3
MRAQDIVKLVVSLLLPLGSGAIGGLATSAAIPTWYQELSKPAFSPPNWLFGPAWTVLYLLMGIAAFLVWRLGWGTPGVRIALAAFLGQLLLNALWSLLFFGLRSPLAGMVEIVVLWLAVGLTIVLFARVSIAAGLLLLPYIGWVTFAAVLNGAILALNR